MEGLTGSCEDQGFFSVPGGRRDCGEAGAEAGRPVRRLSEADVDSPGAEKWQPSVAL